MQVAKPVGIEAREYQNAIAESAVKANTLVVLPTGLGKTIIALLVAVKRLAAQSDGKVVMLAPTKPLVLQHAEFFREHFPDREVKLSVLTGESPPTARVTDFEESRLIFATPEVVRNDVLSDRYSLNLVSLIIFDEAHRCVRDYAYSEVAENYKRQASNPLILGLTASPSARKERVQEICNKLAITNVEMRTEEDEDVVQYVNEVAINWDRVPLPSGYKEISKILRVALDERTDKLRAMHQLPTGVRANKRMLLELGEKLRRNLRRGGAGSLYGAVILQAQSMSLSHAIDVLETQGLHNLTRYLAKLETASSKSGKSLARDLRILEARRLAFSLEEREHPKQKRLRELVEAEIKHKGDSKIIVFTQYRDTVETLVERLNKLGGVSAVRFVGQATRDMDDVGLTQSEQAGILNDFRNGKYNLLVTTSIGEEGLHIPDVDHVIFYEAVPSEIRLIQRRGRTGRTRQGKMTVLISEGTIDEAYYWTSQRREKQMHRFLQTVRKGTKSPSRTKRTLDDWSSPQST
ncbi:MAG TPA: DEAD/DEAH box helicase [Candidatus Bathyarchaeia archaeon]|nr:DEAD/DEAH box helicase [Candidatus Bathyarchaeia archaeon]